MSCWRLGGLIVSVLVLLCGIATPSFAVSPCEKPSIEDAPLPNLAGCVSFRLFNDALVDSEVGGQRRNELLAKIESLTLFQITDQLSFFLHKTFEPVTEARPGKSRTFGDYGLYLEELYVAWTEKELFGRAGFGAELMLGKWNLPFGRAYNDVFTGYGLDFATDYEFNERVGALLTFDFQPTENLRLSQFAGIFTRDIWLTGTLFKSRGSLGPNDGGAGNTGRLDSFILGASAAFKSLSGLELWASYVDQARAPGTAQRERAFVLGASLHWKLSEDFGLHPLIEYAHFAHFDNAPAERRDYFTVSLQADWQDPILPGRSRAVISYTLRDVRGEGDTRVARRDGLVAVTFGHKLANELDFAVGYKYADEAGVASHSIGFLVTWKFDYGPFGKASKDTKPAN